MIMFARVKPLESGENDSAKRLKNPGDYFGHHSWSETHSLSTPRVCKHSIWFEFMPPFITIITISDGEKNYFWEQNQTKPLAFEAVSLNFFFVTIAENFEFFLQIVKSQFACFFVCKFSKWQILSLLAIFGNCERDGNRAFRQFSFTKLSSFSWQLSRHCNHRSVLENRPVSILYWRVDPGHINHCDL